MKRILAALLFLATAFTALPTQALAAASCDDSVISYLHLPVCACYHDVAYCDSYTPTISSYAFGEAECTTYCKQIYGDYYVSSVVNGGKDTCEGKAVASACAATNAQARTATSTGNQALFDAAAKTSPGYPTPSLSVAIPGVDFAKPLVIDGQVYSNFIGTYVSGIYNFLILFAITIAIVMMMVGGIQYVLGASSGDVKGGKKRIKDAVEGFVLLMFVYIILLTVNPQLTIFKELEITSVDQIKLSMDTDGPEGEPSACGGISSYKDMPDPYKSMIASAKAGAACPLTGTDPYDSPTGKPPNCGTHHWYDRGVSGDWRKDHNLDYAATWGTSFHSPFAGTVSYQVRSTANNMCGNTITLKGENGVLAYICHAKDFVDDNGNKLTDGASVPKGQVLGHIGGRCCAGQTAPSGWSAGKSCTFQGTTCSDPNKLETCDCQVVAQSGNTTGPHVHISWAGAGNILSCLDD